MFSSPCNPSGAVYSKEELRSLATVFAKHPNLYILSDEIYEYINFVGHHESIAQFEEIKDRIIIINGLSKGFAMTGYRLGYIAANPIVAKGCEKIQGQFTSGANAITQRAAITALRQLGPARLIVAVPVAAAETYHEIAAEVDEIVCHETPDAFSAISEWYERFEQTTDDKVRDLLSKAA